MGSIFIFLWQFFAELWVDVNKSGDEPPSGAPLELPSLDLGFLEAALAADLITAARSLPGRLR